MNLVFREGNRWLAERFRFLQRCDSTSQAEHNRRDIVQCELYPRKACDLQLDARWQSWQGICHLESSACEKNWRKWDKTANWAAVVSMPHVLEDSNEITHESFLRSMLRTSGLIGLHLSQNAESRFYVIPMLEQMNAEVSIPYSQVEQLVWGLSWSFEQFLGRQRLSRQNVLPVSCLWVAWGLDCLANHCTGRVE